MMAKRFARFARKWLLTLLCLLAATPGWCRVLLRWTQPSIPPAASIGIREVVISWDAESLVKAARGQGYRVYAEVPVGKAAEIIRSAGKSNLAGIVINAGNSKADQTDGDLRQLRSAFPSLPVLVLNARGKQPEMKGQLVIKRDGVLQVTSPTAQPWIDSNLALVRLDRTFRPQQTPLYEFQWDQSDSMQQEYGPSAADYSLALAEAGAFHADLVLSLHPGLQTDLAKKVPAAWAVLNEIGAPRPFIRQQKSERASPRPTSA